MRKQLQRALQTTTLELNLARSTHSVEIVSKDEDIRKLRFQLLLLEDENDGLHEQLQAEDVRMEELEQSLDDALARSEQKEAELQTVFNELRMKTREMEITKVVIVSSPSTRLF